MTDSSSHLKKALFYVGTVIIIIALGIFYVVKNVYSNKYVPSQLILQVPFSTQAPNDNWSRNEDCEETSITMANAFLTGTMEDKLPADAAQQAINNLKIWEQANLGYNANTGADATTKMAEGAFGLSVTQIPNFTEAALKNALINKHPILLPINARLLPDTHYANGGPLYHMIVIRGFKGDTFIVNDPGTDSGDGNQYTFTTLQKAAANWNNSTQSIDPNTKIALVISK